MGIRIFDYRQKEDFGTEHIFTLLKGKRRSFIQVSFSFNDFPGRPYLQISFGNNNLIDILFWVWRFGFALTVFDYTWDSWDK
jgi:hypothetical protein